MKYTKNELYHRYFPSFCIYNWLCSTICRNFKNACFTELLATSFYWLPGDSNKISATCYSLAETCLIANQNVPSGHGCILDASLRRVIQGLRDISKRANLQISETSPWRLIKLIFLT